MRDELQELVDQVSRLLAAPATLEDAEVTLLAFCAHDGAALSVLDAVRTSSILTRGSPPATRRWFEEFGIARADGPLRTPPDPAAGILTRLVIPVRHAGRTHGYLWLLDEGGTGPGDAADPAAAGAAGCARGGARSGAPPPPRRWRPPSTWRPRPGGCWPGANRPRAPSTGRSGRR